MTNKVKILTILAMSLLVLALAACSSDDKEDEGTDTGAAATATPTAATEPTPAEAAETAAMTEKAAATGIEHAVEFSHFFFDPDGITVTVGDTIVFQNLETMNHPLHNEELSLDTGEFNKGERSFTFTQLGSFTVTNTAHDTEFIVNVVEDADLMK